METRKLLSERARQEILSPKAALLREIWKIEDFLESAYESYKTQRGKGRVILECGGEKKLSAPRDRKKCMRDKSTIRRHCGACGKPYPRDLKKMV